MRLNSKKAFSLLELSIVLIIISFLVAAVTTGASLVTSSRISTTLTDLEKLDTWSNSFKAKYDFYAGDMSTAETVFGNPGSDSNEVENGNADGYIGNATPIEDESLEFFHQLFLAGISDLPFTGGDLTAASQVVIGTHYPKTLLGSNTYFYVRSDNLTANFTRQNRFALSSLNSGGALSPDLAEKFDTKIDDGNPLTGIIIAAAPGDIGLSSLNEYPVYAQDHNTSSFVIARNEVTKQSIFSQSYNTLYGIAAAFKESLAMTRDSHAAAATNCFKQGTQTTMAEMDAVSEMEAAEYDTTVSGNTCVVMRSMNKKKNKIHPDLPSTPPDSCVTQPGTGTYHVQAWNTSAVVNGTTITGSCSSGYDGGPVSLTCTDGDWGSLSGECALNQCAAVTTVASGTGYATWALTDASTNGVGGTCTDGYSGSPTRSCDSEGEWGAISNACAPQCAAVTTAASGTGYATWPTTNASATASGTCTSGYSGSPTRACSSAGAWESVSSACAPQCAAVTIAASGTGYATWPVTNARATASPTACATNYKQDTTAPTRACNSSGVWQTTSNPCIPVTCAAITTAGSGTGYATYSETNAGSSATGTCANGYDQADAGAATRSCTNSSGSGVWG